MIRRALGWTARLYPSAWRERYGDEFLATVEDMPAPGWATVWDAAKGAIAMQLHQNGRTFFRRAAIFGLAGFLLAGLVSLQIPDEFHAAATLGAGNTDAESIRQAARRALSRGQLLELVDKHGLYASERARLPLEDIYGTMRNNIKVSALRGQDPSKRFFQLGFTYENGPLAQRVTNDLVAALLQENHAANGRVSLTVLDAPPNPSPIYPNRPVFALTGLLGGALLGAAWTLFRRT